MTALFLNPFTYWLRWLYKKWSLQLKYSGKHLRVEYMAEVKDCKFNTYNTVYKFARLRNSELGDYTYVARESQIFNTKVGKFTCIGPNVSTGMGAHPSAEFVSIHPLFYSTIGQSSGLVIVEKNLFDEYPHTEIGNDVWIGNNVTVRSGVKIGDGAIIGSGAVVTKDVEPYSIVGGVPAKIIKYRFSQDEIEYQLQFKWWDKDLEWLKKNKHNFQNLGSFMAQNPLK